MGFEKVTHDQLYVTQATLVAELLYASPAWSGFIKADEKAKLQSVLNKAVRYGFFSTQLQSGFCLNHLMLHFVLGYFKAS